MTATVPPCGSVPGSDSLSVGGGTGFRPIPSHSVPGHTSGTENRPLGRASVPRFHVREMAFGTVGRGFCLHVKKNGGARTVTPACGRCGSALHSTEAHAGPRSAPPARPPSVPPVPPAPPASEPEPADGTIWIDSAGHKVEPATDSDRWIHVDGPVRDCPVVLWLLRPPPVDAATISGMGSPWFSSRARLVINFDTECPVEPTGEAPT